MLAWIPTSQAAYQETMGPNGLTKNLKTDFGLVDENAKNNQSEILQKAIDDVSAKGGGCLILPKGRIFTIEDCAPYAQCKLIQN